MSKGITSHRPRAEKIEHQVHPQPDSDDSLNVFAQQPQVIRTNQEILLTFGLQKLEDVRFSNGKPISSSRAKLQWALSRDGGWNWTFYDRPPEIGRIIHASYGAILRDGGLATITQQSRLDECFSLVQKGQVGWAPEHNELPMLGSEKLYQMEEYEQFLFKEMIRTSDGVLLAGGRAEKKGASSNLPSKRESEIIFLRSMNEARSFCYYSSIPNPEDAWLDDVGIVEGENNYVLAVMTARASKDGAPVSYLYQSYSLNSGRTWSTPEQIDIEGTEPSLFRLRDGFAVLLSKSLSDPYSIQTVLSDDDGGTWNTNAIRHLHLDSSGFGGYGGARAVQLQDATILCTYHAHLTEPNSEGPTPTGIFVSLFDEDWVRRGDVK